MRYFLGMLLCLVSVMVLAETGTAWKLEKNEDGIKVYTARIDGSDFKAFKASMEIDATLKQIVSMHLDPDDIAEWLYDCKKSELLKKVDENEYYIYYVSEAPWPVQDRDYVLHSVITQSAHDKSVKIAFESVTGFKEESEECVRMATVTGHWLFKPMNNGKINVEYFVHADPNGELPAWLANAAVVEQPFKTLKTIRNKINQPKYVNAQVSFICEPNEC